MIKFGVIMDPIASVNVEKDTSLAILLEAQRRGYVIYFMEINSLYLHNNAPRAIAYLLVIQKGCNPWFRFINQLDINLGELDIILIRKNPPFDAQFMYATYILERAENDGVLIFNSPKSLRDCNEKIFATCFMHYMPETLVSCQENHIRSFLYKHQDIILKPLNAMGGASVFRVKEDDPNVSVIIENLTNYGRRFCMAQQYLPDIQYGDKRILVVDGNPIPYCLARIPKQGETRGNLAAGGRAVPQMLDNIDRKIAYTIAPELKKKGLIFVGLDVIGKHLTEINITSPTCVREIEAAFPISITGILIDAVEKYLKEK